MPFGKDHVDLAQAHGMSSSAFNLPTRLVSHREGGKEFGKAEVLLSGLSWSAPLEVIHPFCWSTDLDGDQRDGKEAQT
jgi:hypothetical protein